MHKPIPVTRIIEFLGNQIKAVYGNPDKFRVSYLRDLPHVDEFTLDWINPARPEKQQMAETSKAKVIVANSEVSYTENLRHQNKVILVVKNPKLAVAKVGNEFFVERPQPGIHPTAVLHPDVKLGKNVFIGPHTSIGKCNIGNDVVIHAGVTLYDNVTIKNNVLIHAGSVIGTDGLGCEREKDGKLVKFPHFGGVIINDNVEIGANCQIAKGALSDTVIGKGTKINVGCFIAHNTILGINVWLSPRVNITGSVKIGNNVTIFSGAIIREQKRIGKDAVVGMGAVVTKDVPAGETWIGNPARKLNK